MAKTAIIFGSTGLVGSALLQILLDSSEYAKVKVFIRKRSNLNHSKLEEIITDFDNIESIRDEITGDDIYMCLGTTMAKAESKDAFYKVDYTYTMLAAKLAFEQNVKKLCLISSLGADKNAAVYYSQIKGKIEDDITQLGFETIYIVRPSLLLGNRKENRLGERIGVFLSKALKFLFFGPLAKYKPIQDITVAKAMFTLMQKEYTGCHIYESSELQKFK